MTGARAGLAYVSPKTGRAVALGAAGEWADRLLPLPAFLSPDGGAASPEALAQAMLLTGHFLTRALVPDPTMRPLPEARARLATALGRGRAG